MDVKSNGDVLVLCFKSKEDCIKYVNCFPEDRAEYPTDVEGRPLSDFARGKLNNDNWVTKGESGNWCYTHPTHPGSQKWRAL